MYPTPLSYLESWGAGWGALAAPCLSVDVGAFVTLCPDLLSALGKAYSSELPVLAERMHRVSSPVSSPLACQLLPCEWRGGH